MPKHESMKKPELPETVRPPDPTARSEGDKASEAIVKGVLLGPPDKLRIPADGPIDYVGRLDDGSQYMAFVTGAVPDGYLFNLVRMTGEG
jgi:hypothetical protein